MSFIHEGLRVDDFLVEERQPQYSRTYGTLKNVGGSAVELQSTIARVVRKNGTQWEFLAAGSEANAGGICISRKAFKAGAGAVGTEVYVIIERGPVIFNRDKLIQKDLTGANFDWAAVETALVAKGFKFISESPEMEKQTT